jgi:hypothetical protein
MIPDKDLLHLRKEGAVGWSLKKDKDKKERGYRNTPSFV